MSTQEQGSSAMSPVSKASKTPRVLSCVLCQQRKVKCDRKFPCNNCTRAGVQCVPSGLVPRQRRRRFAEKELLDRLRHYEDLLRKNKVDFDPMHGPDSKAREESASPEPNHDGPDSPVDVGRLKIDEGAKKKMFNSNEPPRTGAKSYWAAMKHWSFGQAEGVSDNEENREDDSDAPDEVRDMVFKRVWNRLFSSDDSYLMLAGKNNVDLHMFHPSPAHILKLWQIYSENVSPLLKVTHTPSLQADVIDTMADMLNIRPTLEALMFAIYATAVRSLDDTQCLTLFGSSKDDLSTSYQFGCQQALMNCGVLATNERECLTALFLYMTAIRPVTDNRSLSATMGIAIRIGERMGINSEAANIKYPALEAELRRRLWWALILFDHRVTEMTGYKSLIMTPVWDCRPPSNVNDSDFRAEMKTSPAAYQHPSESIFAVVRTEMADYLRHCRCYIDFINPALNAVAKHTSPVVETEEGEIIHLEKMIEDKYLRLCNPENPLQFLTIWFARSYMAKNRLMETYALLPKSAATETQRDAATMHGIRMIEADTQMISSPMTKGYFWLTAFQFPFPAYYHLVQDLVKRPSAKHADRAWMALDGNYSARTLAESDIRANVLFKIFSKPLIQAWKAREALPLQPGILRDMPFIVAAVFDHVAESTLSGAADTGTGTQTTGSSPMSWNMDDIFMSNPFTVGSASMMPMMSVPTFGTSTIDTVMSPPTAFAQPDLNAQSLSTAGWAPSTNTNMWP